MEHLSSDLPFDKLRVSHRPRRVTALTRPEQVAAMPHQSVKPEKRRFARTLRREMTEAEERLWHELRGRKLDGIKFRRQVPVGQ